MKRWIKVAAVAFLAFELWRFVIVGRSLIPFWNDRLLPELVSIGDYPPGTMAVVILVTFVAFAIPMVGLVFALRFVHRRLSRFRTAR